MAEFIQRFYDKKIRHIMGGPSLSRVYLGADRGQRAWYMEISMSLARVGLELLNYHFTITYRLFLVNMTSTAKKHQMKGKF